MIDRGSSREPLATTERHTSTERDRKFLRKPRLRGLTQRVRRAPTPHVGATPQRDPWSWLVQRVGAQELRRRLWHFLPGLLAFALVPIPHRDPMPYSTIFVLIALVIAIPGWLSYRLHWFYRRHPEEHLTPALVGYAVPLAVLCLLCPGSIEIPLASAVIVAFGDGSATLAGRLFRGRQLPWNPRKTWSGLIAFMTMGTLMATAIYFLEARPGIPLSVALSVIAPVVVLCALIESLPLRWNDNVTVGFSSAALLLASHAMIIG